MLLTAAVACGKGSSPSADSGSSAAQKAAGPRPAIVGGVKGVVGNLDDLLANASTFASFVGNAETTTPLQNAHVVTIKKSASCTKSSRAILTVETFATAGIFSFSDLTLGTANAGVTGYPIARIQNDGDCSPDGIPIPAKNGSQPGVVIVFVALANGANPNDPTQYHVRFIDSVTNADVSSARLAIKECAPDPKHQWFGDHSLAKKYANKCDHAKPPKTFAMTN
jgi:hypothetical protein